MKRLIEEGAEESITDNNIICPRAYTLDVYWSKFTRGGTWMGFQIIRIHRTGGGVHRVILGNFIYFLQDLFRILIAIEQNPEIMRNEKKFDQKTNNFVTSTWWKDTKGMQIKEMKTLHNQSEVQFNVVHETLQRRSGRLGRRLAKKEDTAPSCKLLMNFRSANNASIESTVPIASAAWDS
ncbi:hypothetical protein ACJX0J_020279 [Zea mays]